MVRLSNFISACHCSISHKQNRTKSSLSICFLFTRIYSLWLKGHSKAKTMNKEYKELKTMTISLALARLSGPRQTSIPGLQDATLSVKVKKTLKLKCLCQSSMLMVFAASYVEREEDAIRKKNIALLSTIFLLFYFFRNLYYEGTTL